MAKDAERKGGNQNPTGERVEHSEEGRCVSCKKPIPLGAEKCTHCGTYQDWRRFVFSWTALIAAILSLAPLGYGAYWLYNHFFPEPVPPAQVRARLTACTRTEIALELRNRGGQAASVSRPRFQIHTLAGSQALLMDAFWESDPYQEDDRALDPGERDTQVYKANFTPFFSRRESETGRCRITVEIGVTPDSGQHPPASHECRCASSN